MSKSITTINPFTGKELKTYQVYDRKEIEKTLSKAIEAFEKWKLLGIKERIKPLKRLAELMNEAKEDLGRLITSEMGKPIKESIAEIEKCILLCDFYTKNADLLLSDEIIETDADESFISYDPLGCILAIMPWNYPFWQVMRFAIPTLTAGNVGLLKHASNTTGCAVKIQSLFEEAGYPKGCFQSLIVQHQEIEQIIADDRIKAVTLTGSEKAGRAIAGIAGKNLKKTVLELGGNNACLILKDAELEKYMETMVKARMQNTGQSCIAAKRFIVVEDIYEDFIEQFKAMVESLKVGDPTDKSTEFGVLARPDLAETLKKQVDESIEKGAELVIGNEVRGSYFSPTILTNVKPGMPVFDEETFGPVAAIIKVKDRTEAFKVNANTKFGLGTMIITKNTEKAVEQCIQIEDGAYFINELVKSDPRLPFGGTKASGYGRELSREGILEFVNKKTVFVKS
ncbi:NAD-dependent succinate-semialdehyde dehydrogenase [Aegicerativicinus sediminis]|uniref:NAD-dependent succinate-semialdehyde dehydrogenase n=1 Tax=Aegicerativicinus sediminis TaxID=2893202 RepID=UPI001E610D78|nr:NAD-dependent succinate-semialdehyde dehydrogenase [Aegicerativicinus sediminis]